MMRTRLIGGAAAAAAAALAAGCSNTTTPSSAAAPPPAVSPSSAPADRNAEDVAFLQGMIPHHRQATEMAALASARAASPQVKDLAVRIEQAQGPEIKQMSAMLSAWGQPLPEPGSMGMMAMNGMMSPQQMGGLVGSSGPAFDRMFLTMMIEHHRGAIEMAQGELAQGRSPATQQLAQSIITSQQAETTEMQALLGRV